MRGNIWQSDFLNAKLHKPVDRLEWAMTPQTYNAYYNPSNNEIVLPAAIFILPGIADSLVDDAVVYGYAGGTTIGHEITHGFDDQGRQFDERGNLTDWWTPADVTEFNRRAAGIVRQFDAYVATGDSPRQRLGDAGGEHRRPGRDADRVGRVQEDRRSTSAANRSAASRRRSGSSSAGRSAGWARSVPRTSRCG